ncbi:MAG: glycoside hydrolase, partial [Myxococcales bacterium]|nr:glycoside hydrolase [Myxococcales bacterium]
MSPRDVAFLAGALIAGALLGALAANAATDYWPHPPVQVSSSTPFAACPSPQVAEAILDSEVEPHLAVNPTDPAHLAAAWQQDRGGSGGSALGNVAAVSFDGGVTWQQGAIPSLTECSGGAFDYATDPWLAFTADGVLWAIALVWDDPPSDLHSLVVSRSDNGGLSWGDPVPVASGLYPEDWPDKEVILADPSAPDFVYVAFSRLDSSGGLPSGSPVGRSFFVRSTDGGVSWEPERLVYDPGAGFDLRGAQLFVLPDGTLVYLVRERDVS